MSSDDAEKERVSVGADLQKILREPWSIHIERDGRGAVFI